MNLLTKHFRLPEPGDVAARELHEANLELLHAHTRREAARVELRSCEAHIDILNERRKRLEAYVANFLAPTGGPHG